MRVGRRSWCAGAAAASAALAYPRLSVEGQAVGSQTLVFVRHATFFSQETHRSPAVDPQVFVRDATEPEGTGPQSIEHAAGFRPARLDDAPDAAVYNAQGTKLGFSLDRWLAATGTAELIPRKGGDRIACSFQGLIAFGSYSLFKIVFSSEGAAFTPLDGDGSSNSFTAGVDGSAEVGVTALQPLQSGNAIVLIYHSDGRAHGMSRGQLGVTAHHELIARLP